MKNLTIGFLAAIASLNLSAQVPQPATEPQKQDATAQVEKTQPEGMTLKDGQVWLFENGKATVITEETWTRRGMQITPSGTIIFANGEKAKLREGDFVTFDGAVARPIALKEKDNTVAYNRR